MADHRRKRCGFSWTRREFLIASGGSALSSATKGISAVTGIPASHGVRFTLFRSRDLLKWEVFSDGLRVDANPVTGKLTLRPITSGGAPIIQVGLGAQHLLEEAIPEDTTGSTIPRRGRLHAMSAEATTLIRG